LRRHLGRLVLFVLAGVLSSSCGRREVPVYPVQGQVLRDGHALDGAVVVFHPQDAAQRTLTAHTDASGRFSLTTHKATDGAVAGTYAVTVEYRDLVREGDEQVRRGINRLPIRYTQPDTSGLRCEIIPGTNELPPWNLVGH
jgi:hypothetical protein